MTAPQSTRFAPPLYEVFELWGNLLIYTTMQSAVVACFSDRTSSIHPPSQPHSNTHTNSLSLSLSVQIFFFFLLGTFIFLFNLLIYDRRVKATPQPHVSKSIIEVQSKEDGESIDWKICRAVYSLSPKTALTHWYFGLMLVALQERCALLLFLLL
jgi:hypothetical protein